MTMLEKAAKAHYEASHDMRVELAWEACHPDYRAQKITAMAAAITALMEPDEGQLRAGYEATHDPHATPAGGLTRWATWEEACEMEGWREERARAYRAMLKATLAED